MSGGSAGPAGVKNLRAMFENKKSDQSTSPPSRGRSPNGSVSSATSRPVSTVRASFVAADRPGEAGQALQPGFRKQSDVSSMAEVREQAMNGDGGSATSKPVSNDTPASSATGLDLGAILKGSPFEGSSVYAPEQMTPNPKSETPNTQPPGKPKINGSMDKIGYPMGGSQQSEQAKAKAEPVTDKTTNPTKSTKPSPASLNTKAAAALRSKNSPTMSVKSPVLEKKAQQSPTIVNGNGSAIKPRGGVSKIQGVMQSAKTAKETRAKAVQSKPAPTKEEKKPIAKDVKPPSVASKSTAASKAHAHNKASTSEEPKQPRSPTATRPVKLPAAATKATAASSARKEASYESEDAAKATAERVSKMVGAPRVANVSTRASLAKKSSRASLANGDERPKTRTSTASRPTDEGFLSRMTRPTAATAQKTHDKVQVNSPPRQRQTSASHTSSKKPGRKSLNLVSNDMDTAKSPIASKEHRYEDATLKPVHEDVQIPLTTEHVERHDEGEPGPAEEDESDPPPQAGEPATTTA